MTDRTVPLDRSATFALDLASQPDGYLAPSSEVIDELRRAGLVMTQNVGDGFMIVRAIKKPTMRLAGNRRWVLVRDQVTA